MSLSVASVTVTYNAARVLPRQIEALLRQTRPLQEIVVVDNASTDGTSQSLAERYPQVKVLRMSENLGVGSGVAAGLTYAALEKRHDWVWTFDADSVPTDDALETLLAAIESLGNTEGEVGMVAPLAVHQGTGTCYPPLLWRHGYVKPSAELLRQPIWFADLVIASGCMVRRDVVEKVGLPRADFFMYFVDYEYCLRARSHGYKIAVVTRSRLAHEVGRARKVQLPGYSGLWPERAPWLEYYLSRNLAYVAWRLYADCRTKLFVVRHLARHAAGVLLFNSNKLACLKKMAQGFWDGRRARLGVRFRPPEVASKTSLPEIAGRRATAPRRRRSPGGTKPKIGIDAHTIGERKTGNETYVYHLAKYLSQMESNGFEYVLYLTNRQTAQRPLFPNSRFTQRPIRPATPYVRIPLAFPREIRRRHLDLFHAQYILPPNMPCRSVLTIHDIGFEHHPQLYAGVEGLRNKLLVPWSARRADWIITGSEYSKRDLVECYRLDPDRISVIYYSARDGCGPMDRELARERLKRRYGIEGDFILYVGNLQPRKNVPRLIAAFARLRQRRGIPHKLVVVGKKAWRYDAAFEAVRRASVEDSVVFTGYVDSDDLPCFYNAATVFAFPSIFEGFGLPVVEAMACGAPTITSRGSALEEIAGDAAVLVDPLDTTEIEAALERVIGDAELKETLRQRGFERARRFSYRLMAERTRQIYEHVLGQ